MRIELHEVRRRFGAQRVLDGVDLVVPSGTRLALVGPNGSGKSTLLRVMMGLLRAEGIVLLDGRSPFRDRRELARDLVYVPQVAPRLGASVLDLVHAIALLRGMDEERVRSVARKLEVDLEAIASKAWSDLSGGTKQKMLVALAFASSSRLLILDEPTASLDARSREAFVEMLEGLGRETTVVFCSHRMEEIDPWVDRVVELSAGRVARDTIARTSSATDPGRDALHG